MEIKGFSKLIPTDISYLDKVFTLPHTKPVPSNILSKIPQNDISLWCMQNAYYQFPSQELIDFLYNEIGGKDAIEIGAGNGCIGRNLGIRITDNCLQNRPDIKAHYQSLNQKTINYPSDIVNLRAEDAIREFKPQVVIGCWITEKIKGGFTIGAVEGADEDFIMTYPSIEKYIVVGNLNTHGNKAILRKYNHKIIQADWLYTRSMAKEKNCIMIFEK